MLLERLLPALLNAVATTVSDADLRFSCLKVMSDLLALLLDLNADGKSLILQHIFIKRQSCTTIERVVLLLSIWCRRQRSFRGYGAAAEGKEAGLSEPLEQMVASELLPLVPSLLEDEKPIPVWALKVVEECLESLPHVAIPALERHPRTPTLY